MEGKATASMLQGMAVVFNDGEVEEVMKQIEPRFHRLAQVAGQRFLRLGRSSCF
jgi:hypothetical protein